MKFYKIYLFLLLLATLFSACEKEIKFKGQVQEPMLVLNGFLTPDSVVSVHLSQSRFAMNYGTRFPSVEKAKAQLFVNGILKESLTPAANGNYRGTYYPRVKDEIEIRVSAAGFPDIKARTVIPAAPVFDLADSTLTYIFKDVTADFPAEKDVTHALVAQKNNFRLSLKDNPNEENFYFMKAEEYRYANNVLINRYVQRLDLRKVVKSDTQGGSSIFDILSEEEDGDLNKTRNMFSDVFVNGKELFFHFEYQDNMKRIKYLNGKKIEETKSEHEKEYRVSLSNMSKEFYQFVVSSSKAENLDGNPFAEPVQVKTNVENGLGILGAYTAKTFKHRVELY